MKERRSSRRTGVQLLLNKYVDGFPHACRAIDLSLGGVLIRRIHEPELQRDGYPLELGLPGAEAPLWIWCRPVWTKGRRQALRFVGMSTNDREQLATFLGHTKRAA